MSYVRINPNLLYHPTKCFLDLALVMGPTGTYNGSFNAWWFSTMGIFVYQLAPNAWRIFIDAEVLWGQLSWGNRALTLKEFFYCYKSQEIDASSGFYNFVCCWASLRLESGMPDSNRTWKNRFFFVQGVNWVFKPDEWNRVGNFYDHAWGVLDKSGRSSIAFP